MTIDDKTLTAPALERSQGRLAGRTLILTGAAGNLGSHMTRMMLREGAQLIVTGRDMDRLQHFTQTLAGEGYDPSRVVPVAADAAGEAADATPSDRRTRWPGAMRCVPRDTTISPSLSVPRT